MQASKKAFPIYLAGIFIHDNYAIKKKQKIKKEVTKKLKNGVPLVYLQDLYLCLQMTGFNCKSTQYWGFSDRVTSDLIIIVVTS